MGTHGEGSQWMPMKTSFSCLEGLSPSIGGEDPFTLPGLERKCLQIAGGGAWTAPHERTQLPAQTLLALGLPQFVLNPS